jgi:hypothetical protein
MFILGNASGLGLHRRPAGSLKRPIFPGKHRGIGPAKEEGTGDITMARSQGLSGLNEETPSHALPPIDQDPVLMHVQQSLMMQGDEISKIVMAGPAANSGSGDVMSALIHLMAEQQEHPAAPVQTQSSSGGGSSAGAWIGVGLSALAAGANIAGSVSGKAPAAPAAKTAAKPATPPPPKPDVKADKPAAPPEAAPQGNPQPEVKPEQP